MLLDEDVAMLVERFSNPQAPIQDATLSEIVLNGDAEQVSTEDVRGAALVPEVIVSSYPQVGWPRNWPGL
jgi:hypothetical protein